MRKLAGTKELFITAATIGDVVNELVRQKPSVGPLILKNGEIAPHIIVMLNGVNVTDLEVSVTEEEVIAIFPLIAGG